MIEELNTGWLAPDGSFYACNHYEHVETAGEIVNKYNYSEFDSEGKHIPADDNLLNRGWCYIGIFLFWVHEWRIFWNKYLTEYQKRFLKPYFENGGLPVNDISKLDWEKEQ